jgi:predicted ATPase/DNA-binding winged helix-turn-helix (wHTH) protein
MATSYEFGPFRLDAEADVLFRGSEPVAIGRKATALLRVLVARPGAPVSKDDLIDAAWPGLSVEDSNLTVQIGALRRVLAQAGAEDWIETLPRRGYRFVGPVTASLKDDHQPAKAVEKPRNNLPVQLTSFVGRSNAIDEIRRLLSANRLLTLVGLGGAGKTRLAINVGAQMLDEFADGVWLAELANLSDPALVPQAVASALGIAEQPGRSITDTLRSYLPSRALLLILDNCEHVLAACSEVAKLCLASSPSIRILATSRENLGITGELVFRVPPLTMPKGDQALSPQALLEFEAPRLFLERAVTQQREFQASEINMREIARICHRLDGLPLAIELAAAQVKVLSVSQIGHRLDDQIRLLNGRNRSEPQRHQTLQAVIDWSYQLLTETERAMLRRLSVFAGGWTLEAAEAVCTGNGVDKDDVLDLMARLVDKSLVVAQTQGSEARYFLLETVRHFGQMKLRECGEADATQREHLHYFMLIAEQAEVLLRGAQVAAWAQRIETENDNTRAALQWALGAGDAGAGLRLAASLAFFWRIRGHVNEGSRWLADLMSRTPDGVYFSRAKAYFAAGLLAWWKGANAQATELIGKGLSIFRALGDKWWIARSLQGIAFHSFARGEYERAASLAEEALTLAQELDDKYVAGYSLVLKAILAERAGDDRNAAAWFDECIAMRREIHHKFGIANALRGLGRVALRHDDYDKAVGCYRESLTLAMECGDVSNAAPSVEGLAALALARGEHRRAGLLIGAAEGLRHMINVPPLSWERDSYENSLKALTATVDAGELNSLRTQGRAMTIEQVVAYCL